jgi:DNA replication and repair protein RecF
VGPNGVGKTNLLDALHYLCLTKSYFSNSDGQNIRNGADFFRIDGTVEQPDKPDNIVYKLQSGKRKEVILNDTPYTKVARHIGKFPAIMITPDDNQLILGGSEERRKFIDGTISQVSADYLDWLITYNKILVQRNAALKTFAETGRTDLALIDTYDESLADLGTRIFKMRKKSLAELAVFFNNVYPVISLNREVAAFDYISQMNGGDYKSLLKQGLKRDIILQRTDVGIHKDDIEFLLSDTKLKKFASQGQQKSFIIALKLAQYHFIHTAKNNKPILLIDDIFDKLDIERSKQLLQIILSDEYGQVFITDTDNDKISLLMNEDSSDYKLIKFELKQHEQQ